MARGGNTCGLFDSCQVLYGSAEGIRPDRKPEIINQDTAGVPGTGEDGDEFGMSLGIGDTDGDKYADVLVGAPGEALGSATGAGQTTLLRGSASGLTSSGSLACSQNASGVPGGAETGDRFGDATHLIDVTKDGRAELMVGTPGENADGLLWTARGTATGPAAGGSTAISGTDAGLRHRYADVDFGAALPSARSNDLTRRLAQPLCGPHRTWRRP